MKSFLNPKFYVGSEGGQSLIEVLVAVALGAIFVLAAATTISPALRVNTEAGRMQAGIALGRELLDNGRTWAGKDWNTLLSLATTSANHYHLTTSSSPFSPVSGDESVEIGNAAYTRYFYVDDVQRNSGGLIVSAGGFPDPSTKKITVIYEWPRSAANALSVYVARSRHRVLNFTDWSGGPEQSGPVTSANPRFATSSKIDYTTTIGSIIIKF